MLYVWAVDPNEPDSCDDCVESGFRVKDDATFEELVQKYRSKYLKEFEEEPDLEEMPVRFWLVSKDTNKAARAVPFGEYDSETMTNTAIRKSILRGGLIREVMPPQS